MSTIKPSFLHNGACILFQRPGETEIEEGTITDLKPHTHIGNNVYVLGYGVRFYDKKDKCEKDTFVAHSSIICWM